MMANEALHLTLILCICAFLGWASWIGLRDPDRALAWLDRNLPFINRWNEIFFSSRSRMRGWIRVQSVCYLLLAVLIGIDLVWRLYRGIHP